MITSFLLNIGSSFVSFLIGLLPSSSGVPTEWTSAVYTIWSDINAFSFIVPVDTLLQVLILALTFHFAIFLYHLTMWVIRKIPGMQ